MDVKTIMSSAAQSLGRSLSIYWPADAGSNHDAAEANVVVHVAHALLQEDFFVFAETLHTGESSHAHIDLLAITPDRRGFVALEAKRYTAAAFSKSIDDLKRLQRFDLNRSLARERVGDAIMETLDVCRSGVGIVAGLKWCPAHSDKPTISASVDRQIRELGGVVEVPLPVTSFDVELPSSRGSYWLMWATLQITSVCA